MNNKYDVILAGLGFASSILAYRLKQVKPDIKILILEQDKDFNFEITWAFFDFDVEPHQLKWVEPLVKYRWERCRSFFPTYTKEVYNPYNAIPPENLYKALESTDIEILFSKKAVDLKPSEVTCEDGSKYSARCIFDGRGPREKNNFSTGIQKFVGIDLELKSPHGLKGPILMDGTVEQIDGFRFMYVLPWTETELMIEDVYYSDTVDLDKDRIRKGILSYAKDKGWQVKSEHRMETGVLLLPFEPDPDLKRDFNRGVPSIGIRGGFFHPITSYTVPACIRMADDVCKQPELESINMTALVHELNHRIMPRRKTYVFLNKMLFVLSRPEERIRIIQWMYKKDEMLVKRFFAGRSKRTDFYNLYITAPRYLFPRAYKLLQ